MEESISTAWFESSTMHETVKARVGSHAVRIIIDTRASSSYVCSDLVTKLSIKPRLKEIICIEQIFETITRSEQIYGTKTNPIINQSSSQVMASNSNGKRFKPRGELHKCRERNNYIFPKYKDKRSETIIFPTKKAGNL